MAWPLPPPLIPHFEAALRDVRAERPESRMAAAERLGHAEGPERAQAFEGLLLLTKDSHPDVRATALAGLGMLADARALDTVLAHLEDEIPAVREFAALATAQIGGDRALAALRRALSSDTPAVRFQAVAAVAELAPDTAAREVVPLLSDPDAEVRSQAVSALAGLDEPHLSGHLAGMLDDPAFAVRLEAALALSALDDGRGERVLVESLAAGERVHDVCQALAAIGAQGARDVLAKVAGSFLGSPYARAATAAALIKLGDPRGVPALRRVLRGLRSDARSYAVELAGQCDADELVPELSRFVERPRGVDPLTLVASLAVFARRSEPARTGLTRLADRKDDVGVAARQALESLGSPAPPTHH